MSEDLSTSRSGVLGKNLLFLLFAFVAIAGFIVIRIQRMPWYDASPAAIEALEADADVAVLEESEAGWWVFMPSAAASVNSETNRSQSTPALEPAFKSGLIFYPGGRVDARAYASLARAIAEQGHPVVVVPMPLGLAVLGSGRAEPVMESFPMVQTWVLAGHSLGGSMAARFAAGQSDRLSGLILLASWPPDDALASLDLPVLSIGATKDGLASPEELRARSKLLPAGTTWHWIEGGNHAQFGDYGPQEGDGVATLGQLEQQAEVVRLVVEHLRRGEVASPSR